MKTAQELTKIYRKAMERKYVELHKEAEKFCEEIESELVEAAENGNYKHRIIIPENIRPIVRAMVQELGYELKASNGAHVISWPCV